MKRSTRYILASLLFAVLVNVGLSDLMATPTTHTGTQPLHRIF